MSKHHSTRFLQRPATAMLALAAALAVVGSRASGVETEQRDMDSAAPTTQPLRAGAIGNGDLIGVTVHALFSPTSRDMLLLRVDDSGTIAFPLIGEVKVAGQTTDRAAQTVAQAAQKAQLIRNAIVVVGIVRPAAESAVKPGPLAKGDKLRIGILELTGPGQWGTTLAQIADDGTVTLPLAGAVKLESLSEKDAAKAIADRYLEKQLIQDATVTVLKLEPNGLP